MRGATTVDRDHPDVIREALEELVSALIAQNGITKESAISLLVSVTDDIHSASPAKIIRLHLGWPELSIMSCLEPDIEGFPPRCIRLQILFYSDVPKVTPLYLRGAQSLRPDLGS